MHPKTPKMTAFALAVTATFAFCLSSCQAPQSDGTAVKALQEAKAEIKALAKQNASSDSMNAAQQAALLARVDSLTVVVSSLNEKLTTVNGKVDHMDKSITAANQRRAQENAVAFQPPARTRGDEEKAASKTTKRTTKERVKEETAGPKAKAPKQKAIPISEETLASWANMDGLSITCGGDELNLAVPLNEVASRLQAQNLMYNVKPFSDCSGVFHRVLDSLDRRCPDHAFPSPKTHRDSRSIGKWFVDNGTFVQIRHPEASYKYIKPGAVMFYMSGSKDPKTIAKDALFKPGGIRHIGVVVDVEKDENGVVTKYTLFHGRTTGKPAAKTNYHTRKPSRSSYPAYGNGRDHWIGVAQIASDKVMD